MTQFNTVGCGDTAAYEIKVTAGTISYVLVRCCERHFRDAAATAARTVPERLARGTLTETALTFKQYNGPFTCEL